MSNISKVIDGDTFEIDGDKKRVGFINTPESVHPNESRNTPAGDVASDFAKDVLPEETPVITHDYGRDHFGRDVTGVTRIIGDKQVDFGLVALDQEMSTYFTTYGEHPDPMKHEQYKEYFSRYAPYQYGQAQKPLDQDTFKQMMVLHENFRNTYAAFKDGDATQEEFDEATANLYGDPEKVTRFRSQLYDWNRPVDMTQHDASDRFAHDIAMQDPELRDQYNRAVRNGHLEVSRAPEQEPEFWNKVSASFSMLNDVSNAFDADRMWATRTKGRDFDVPQTELVKGLPEQFHAAIVAEANKYNDASALMMRDQLIQDINNNRIFDNMEWYAQIGYGAGALVTSPTSLIAGGAIAKAGMATMSGVRSWKASRLVNNTATMATWTAGGAAEGLVANAPRLMGDHTYTAKDLQLDVMMDAGFGLVLGGAIEYAAKPLWKKYVTDARESRAKEQSEIQNYVETRDKPAEAATPELQEDKKVARKNTTENKAKHRVAQVAEVEFTPWEAIDVISPEGFATAARTMEVSVPKNTPLRMLFNRQNKLNRQKLTPEEREIANKLNADILHLAAAFPDGKIPKGVDKSIRAITFTQKTFKRNNAMSDILQGLTTNPTKTLSGYVNMLHGLNVMDGVNVVPVSRRAFMAQQSDWLSRKPGAEGEELFNLSQSVPKELSYLKDMVELNNMAAKMGSEFEEYVEILNGIVTERMAQKEVGDFIPYQDQSKSFGKSVPMTPPEIGAQLKKEGLTPRTTEYSKRMAELKQHGRAAVSQEVNEIGRADTVKVGVQRTEVDPDARFDAGDEPDILSSDVKHTDGQEARTTDLVKDDLDQDLLPRSYTEVETQSVYDTPSVTTLTEMRTRLRSDLLKKLGVLEIKGKKEWSAQQKRLESIRRAMLKDKSTVIKRMMDSQNVLNLVDVIRVSDTLAKEAKARKATMTVPEGETPQVDPIEQPLTEEDFDYLDETITPPQDKTPEEVEAIRIRAAKAYEKMVEESMESVSSGLADFVRTGEKRIFELARKPRGVLDSVGRLAASWTKDLGTKFQEGKLTSLEYIGSRITEIGKGYGGAIRRKATGGLIRDFHYRESLLQVAPTYVQAMDKYALAKGKGAVGRLNAQQQAGADNSIVKQFNRDVFTVQELRRQGRELPKNIDQSVIDFINDWDKYMEYNHAKLVDANIGGFTAKRKVAHYIPHIWEYGKLQGAISKHGLAKVEEVLTRAYQSASNRDRNPVPVEQAKELAQRQIEWIKTQDGSQPLDDQFLPVKDSRAKSRRDLDTTVEVDGLSVLDLLDTEVMGLATKYSNRMAGWVGLSKSTDGMLTSQLDIDTLKQNMIQEGLEKGVKTTQYEQYYDDLINLMFGRPTRGGLNQELRQLKDLTALTRMGGLGTAQLIETGQVITRSVISTFSDPKVAQKVFSLAGESAQDERLIREIQSLSAITNDIEWLDRQSVHLDQHELGKVHKARQLSLWVADKSTFGALKAPASRLLGKTTGFNAIRRVQSRVTQASFMVDVARHFKFGKGKMGNARMADVGLTDINGIDTELEDVFKKFVEFDNAGYPTKLNVDKWPRSAREKLQYAMARDEAQQVQRTHVGELPTWMNKPIMALIFQFRQMPLVAQNKSLGRSMAFADKEAVVGTMLNAALAGMVRYSKFAVLGLGYSALSDNEWKEPTGEQMSAGKYVTQFGMYGDVYYDLVLGHNQVTKDPAEALMNQIPVMGLMKDYYETSVGSEQTSRIEAAQGLVPLGNTAYGDMIHTWLQQTFK